MPKRWTKIAFRRPEEYDAALEQVIHQDDLKVKLKSAFSQYTLFLQDASAGRPLVCVYGESGTGKTFAVEQLAAASGLPVTISSATAISPPGYKNTTLQDILAKHWLDHGTDAGILYIDEIDKWCGGSLRRGDRSGEAVTNGLRSQHEILRYVESERVNFLDMSRDFAALEGVTFNSHRLMWILSGAFVGIADVVRNRLHNYALNHDEVWSQARPDDFIRYGMVDELAKRIQTWAWTTPLDATHLVEILRRQELPRWIRKFAAIGCTLSLDDSALTVCALHAREERLGARGAMELVKRSMDDVFYQASKHRLTECHVDHNVIVTGRLEQEVRA